jgi:hypothetical protein
MNRARLSGHQIVEMLAIPITYHYDRGPSYLPNNNCQPFRMRLTLLFKTTAQFVVLDFAINLRKTLTPAAWYIVWHLASSSGKGEDHCCRSCCLDARGTVRHVSTTFVVMYMSSALPQCSESRPSRGSA